MSKFILKPAHLLQTKLVLSKNEPEIELDFKELVKRFVPDTLPQEKMKLLNLRHGMFIGKSHSQKRQGGKCIFVLFNVDREGSIDFVLKKDPTFEARLLEAYFVESAKYDAKVTETQAKVA
jgi:hypothetical protein